MKVKGLRPIFLGRSGTTEWSGGVAGGRQIGSCELVSLGVGAIGVIRVAICARALAGGLPVSRDGARLWVGAGD
jgi:hypothetical protein